MLRVRWLGRVPYPEALSLQHALHRGTPDDYLLLLEHPHVFTLGRNADPAHILVDPAMVGAAVERTDRGGDVTYHGPGQLVAYPIVSVPTGPSSMPCHVHTVEQIVIDALGSFGLVAGRLSGFPGVWVEPEGPAPRKICAIGVRIARERSMHGLALNVDPDLQWFRRIVPCGIADKAVTSLRAEGLDVSMQEVADALVTAAAARWGAGGVERHDVAWPAAGRPAPMGGPASPDRVYGVGQANPATVGDERSRARRGPGPNLKVRLRRAGVAPGAAIELTARKPEWLRVPAHMGEGFQSLRRTVRSLGLTTVCEEAGCPNIFECWAEGTATFMINGERCTRACGFCLVDTRHPMPLDPDEPEHVAAAVERLGLAHAVITAVARDDLPDGGAAAFAATVAAIRGRCPNTAVELLISDCKGIEHSLDVIFEARPDVLNHNLETVARLQRAVRPSAGYARSLTVLARAKTAGLSTKSGLILGMGEEEDEVIAAMRDLRAVGVDIVTLGQYLRPTKAHVPVVRWWTPEDFERLAASGRAMGFAHVQASPLTRSSYHARSAAEAAGATPPSAPTAAALDAALGP